MRSWTGSCAFPPDEPSAAAGGSLSPARVNADVDAERWRGVLARLRAGLGDLAGFESARAAGPARSRARPLRPPAWLPAQQAHSQPRAF